MADDVPEEKERYTGLYSMDDYFTYNGRPREISIDFYLKVYELFCKAYRIESTDDDKKNFSYLIQKRILDRHNPEGVDYTPRYGSKGYGNARLFVMPKNNCVRFRSYPIRSMFENRDFVTLTQKALKKNKDLEARL